MTTARQDLKDPINPASYHCVSRCLRRAWLCGFDSYLNKSFEHRKPWVTARILEVGAIFACGVYGFAVMSDHLHVVVNMNPKIAYGWSAEEVAQRWLRLYPCKASEDECNFAKLVADDNQIKKYRQRLSDLSWFMKSISEHIARKANTEDNVKGRFWSGRFESQLLKGPADLLSAMTYVDLNPVRAGIAHELSESEHVSVKLRAAAISQSCEKANENLSPLIGERCKSLAKITEQDYLELVQYSAQMWIDSRQPKNSMTEPKVLKVLDMNPQRWLANVRGVGCGYWRVVGAVQEIRALAKRLGKRTMFGIGFSKFVDSC